MGDEDRIEMARPCCIISTGSGLEKLMRTGNDGAVGYHMDAEMALTEASFLAPDDDTKASYLLHTTADEEEERKALSKQMRVHDQMHILVDRPQRQKSLVHCDPTNRQALDTQVRHLSCLFSSAASYFASMKFTPSSLPLNHRLLITIPVAQARRISASAIISTAQGSSPQTFFKVLAQPRFPIFHMLEGYLLRLSWIKSAVSFGVLIMSVLTMLTPRGRSC